MAYTSKQLTNSLVEFMWRKNDIFKPFETLFTKGDEHDLRKYSDDQIFYAATSIKLNLTHQITHLLSDQGICPYCLIHDGYRFSSLLTYCTHCPFQLRHGICENRESTYYNLIKNLRRQTDYEYESLLSYIVEKGYRVYLLEPLQGVK